MQTRPLWWWLHFQKARLKLHKNRFHTWRWEAQMEDAYGAFASLFVDEHVGWVLLAQNGSNYALRFPTSPLRIES